MISADEQGGDDSHGHQGSANLTKSRLRGSGFSEGAPFVQKQKIGEEVTGCAIAVTDVILAGF